MDDGSLGTSAGAELLDHIVRLNRWVTHHTTWAIPLAQARVLSQIRVLGPVRVGELAQAEHCTQPTMTALLHRLQEQGLVARTPDPEDARAVRMALTPSGSQVLAEIRRERAQVVDALIAELPASQRKTLESALPALSALLTAAYRTV